MAQQSNLQTLRIFNKNINLTTNFSQEFVKSLDFLGYFHQFFYQKNIILVKVTLNFIGNKSLLTLSLFVRNIRAKKYLKKIKNSLKINKLIKINKPVSSLKKVSNFFQFFSKNLKPLDFNFCSFKINLLNVRFKKDIGFLRLLYRINKKYIDQLFSRRKPLFFDFLKITCLFARGRASTTTFLFILQQIFRFLLKRKHSRFFHFIKKIFKILIDPKDLKSDIRTKKYKSENKLLGLKFTIAGRLKGKLRSNKKSFIFGRVPNQSISKNIEFSQSDVFTRYGVFGLKLSTYLKL